MVVFKFEEDRNVVILPTDGERVAILQKHKESLYSRPLSLRDTPILVGKTVPQGNQPTKQSPPVPRRIKAKTTLPLFIGQANIWLSGGVDHEAL